MLQAVDGRLVYVIEFENSPTSYLPITGSGIEAPYALALNTAIWNGQLTESGKYGVEVTIEDGTTVYNVYHIVE